MANGLVNMADQFKGLPMEALIGGPLEAAVKANLMMAQSTADFINSVGFDQIVDSNGKLVPGKARTSYFEFERPGVDAHGGRTIEQIKVQVPMLAIVPIPNLQIDTVDVVFDMEVKSSTSEKSSKDSSGKFDVAAKVGWGPFSATVKVSGSTSSHQENTRSSDNSAKYHVEVHAKNYGIPEGLARVLDMMAEAAKPLDVKAYKPNADGLLDVDPATGKPTSTGVAVLPSAEPVEVP
jgi:hypothetical protein